MSYPLNIVLQPGWYAVDGFGTALAGPCLTPADLHAAAVGAGVLGAYMAVNFPVATFWGGWTTTNLDGVQTVIPSATPVQEGTELP